MQCTGAQGEAAHAVYRGTGEAAHVVYRGIGRGNTCSVQGHRERQHVQQLGALTPDNISKYDRDRHKSEVLCHIYDAGCGGYTWGGREESGRWGRVEGVKWEGEGERGRWKEGRGEEERWDREERWGGEKR